MGLVKCIFCKVNHLIVDVVGRLLINPILHTALNALLLIAVHEIMAFLFHDRGLLLTHGPAHQVAPSHGVSGQVTHDLHDLLLVYDTAVGGA